MSLVTVTLDINGEAVRAEDASWYLVAPCGCTSGACVVDMIDGYNLTEESALAMMYGNAELCRRGIRAGFTVILGKRSEAVARLTTDCPHRPRYGVPVVPIPDGYAWAEHYDSPRSHLVPAEHAQGPQEGRPWREHLAAALCVTGEPTSRDRHLWHKPFERVTCRRCEKAALNLAGGAA